METKKNESFYLRFNKKLKNGKVTALSVGALTRRIVDKNILKYLIKKSIIDYVY